MSNTAVVNSRLSNLRSKESRLVAESAALIAAGLRTAEDRSRNESILLELTDTRDTIQMIQQTVNALPADALVAAPVTSVAIRTNKTASAERREQRAKLNKQLAHMLRHGVQPHSVEQRDLESDSDSLGGALVPQTFQGDFAFSQKLIGPIGSLVTVATQSDGASRKFPSVDDTASTANYLPEIGSSSSLSEDAALFSNVKALDTILTKLTYSYQMLQDGFDFSQFVNKLAGIRMARAVEYVLSLGAANGNPGIAMPNQPTGGILGQVSTGLTASSGTLAAPPLFSLLGELKAEVDMAYQVTGSFMVAPATYNYMEQLTDTVGAPVFRHNDQGQLVAYGRPVYTNAAMKEFNTASSPIALFGDYSYLAAMVNTPVRIKPMLETHSDVLVGEAIVYQRLGSTITVANAVKSLVSAAS